MKKHFYRGQHSSCMCVALLPMYPSLSCARFFLYSLACKRAFVCTEHSAHSSESTRAHCQSATENREVKRRALGKCAFSSRSLHSAHLTCLFQFSVLVVRASIAHTNSITCLVPRSASARFKICNCYVEERRKTYIQISAQNRSQQQ